MIDALHYETVRIRTIGSTYWALIIGLGLCALIAFGFGVGPVLGRRQVEALGWAHGKGQGQHGAR